MGEKERINKIYSEYNENMTWKERYSIFREEVICSVQEVERKKLALLKKVEFAGKLQFCKVIDIGGGSGSNVLRMVEYGVPPENIVYNEIFEPRYKNALKRLPRDTETILCDACELDKTHNERYDIVCMNTVMTSILEDEIRIRLANRIWKIIKPGGGILWYDFKYNNPKNPNVKKVTTADLNNLFPEGKISIKSATLAPPIARSLIKIPFLGVALLKILNVYPLGTHIVAFIQKNKI